MVAGAGLLRGWCDASVELDEVVHELSSDSWLGLATGPSCAGGVDDAATAPAGAPPAGSRLALPALAGTLIADVPFDCGWPWAPTVVPLAVVLACSSSASRLRWVEPSWRRFGGDVCTGGALIGLPALRRFTRTDTSSNGTMNGLRCRRHGSCLRR